MVTKSILQQNFLAATVRALHPREALCRSEKTPLQEILETLTSHGVGSVILTDEQNIITGIFTERDLISKELAHGPDSKHQPVARFMTNLVQTVKSSDSIARALYLMAMGGFRHVPVLCPTYETPHIISTTHFVDYVYAHITPPTTQAEGQDFFDKEASTNFFESDVSRLQVQPAIVLKPTSMVSEALQVMKNMKQGACVIVDGRKTPIGIFTERDYLTRVAVRDRVLHEVPLQEVMTELTLTVNLSTKISTAFHLLAGKHIRSLPVVHPSGALLGMLTVRDFVVFLANQIVSELQQAHQAE